MSRNSLLEAGTISDVLMTSTGFYPSLTKCLSVCLWTKCLSVSIIYKPDVVHPCKIHQLRKFDFENKNDLLRSKDIKRIEGKDSVIKQQIANF